MLSIIQAAGWPIWPLLICSIAALALVIERFSSLRIARVAPTRLLDEVISVTRAHLPAAEVVNKLHENSVLGTVLAAGLRAVIAGVLGYMVCWALAVMVWRHLAVAEEAAARAAAEQRRAALLTEIERRRAALDEEEAPL